MGNALRPVTPFGSRRLQRAVLITVILLFVVPIVAGLWETGRAAFGHLPAIGAVDFGLDPWRQFFAVPGVLTSIGTSLITGIGATLLSLLLAVGFAAMMHDRMNRKTSGRLLAPFLAAPHAAIAIGLAFVLSPSGWLARLLAPLFGLDHPPELATVNDPWGIALVIGLIVKEMPFLLLVILTAMTQIPLRTHMAAGRSLGYRPANIWLRLIMPQIWPLIRLPVYVVTAYALSVVDMAIILGPSGPPTLAVILTRMFSDPDIAMILPASAGGLVQAGLVIFGIALLWVGEKLIQHFGLLWLRVGKRRSIAEAILSIGAVVAVGGMLLGALAMLSLLIWSFAWRWSWPEILPESWSWQFWGRPGTGWGRALRTTVVLAIATTVLSLTLAIAWLEAEDRARMTRAKWAEALIYLPLLIPQIAFLFGLNILFLHMQITSGMMAVIWAQTLFVFPYVMIALSDPWRALDPRLTRAAASLGAGPWRRLFRVKLPMLLSPILTAAAIGIAVSVAQYLPTLFMGAGRIASLTTEAVTLSSSSDRRVTGIYATLQAVLPMLCYLLAFAIPAMLHRHRQDLQQG